MTLEKTEILEYLRSGKRLSQPEFATANMRVYQPTISNFELKFDINITIQIRLYAAVLEHRSQATTEF
jgi:hypothetical protein